MALVLAKHKVYGVVSVPASWLRMWPNEYKPVRENAPARRSSGEVKEDDDNATDR